MQNARDIMERTTEAANVTNTTRGCETNVDTSNEDTKHDAPTTARRRGISARRLRRVSVSGRRRKWEPEGEARKSAIIVAMTSKVNPDRERALEMSGSCPGPVVGIVRTRAAL